jgi:sugar lactone lactonase YvrE
MTIFEPECVLEACAELGDGPVWDHRESALWWVDINGHAVHRFDPATGEDTAYDMGEMVGAVVPRIRGGLVMAAHSGFYFFRPETGEREFLGHPEAHLANNRFNDGKCDPAGRFWAGSAAMDGVQGGAGLYCLGVDGAITQFLDSVTVSNGMAWSLDRTTMYYIDSMAQCVSAFDYDLETGNISNQRAVIAIERTDGFPDGMTIDTEGKLWVAHWGGARVVRYDPETGEALAKVAVPVSQPTSCAFGGDGQRDLYITTARASIRGDALAAQPLAGSLFRVRLEVGGRETDFYAG